MPEDLIHIYTPQDMIDSSRRGHLFPLLKPLINKENELYSGFRLVKEPGLADIIIFPMSWLYQCNHQLENYTLRFIDKMRVFKKPIWLMMPGDSELPFPMAKPVFMLQLQGYRSRLDARQKIAPVFIADPLAKLHLNEIEIRPYNKVPVVGFCGLASNDKIQFIKIKFKLCLKRMLHPVGLYRFKPHELIVPQWLRFQLMQVLEQASGIRTNFIYRKRYRAGIKRSNKKDRQKSTHEFFNNINTSDYVLCIRGAGNFSTRLYETLAMGRIPVLVDTDCAMPLVHEINWHEHVVWIPYKQRQNIAKLIKDFHERIGEKGFIDLQRANRNLWENKLQLFPFFRRLFSSLKET